MTEPLVTLYFNGEATSLERSVEPTFSAFGGPLELEVKGLQIERPLHHIAYLNHNEVAAIRPPRYIFDLPLLYGMKYSDAL